VQTASRDILKGTIRACVLDACGSLNIPVLLEAPRVQDMHSWDECFITSTSRLVMRVDEIEEHRTSFSSTKTTDLIRTWVEQAVWSKSRDVRDYLESKI